MIIFFHFIGINRTGNLLVPNDDYCDFEDWMMPILDYMLEKQKKEVDVIINFLSLGIYLDSF